MTAESLVRDALGDALLLHAGGGAYVIEEFWVPRSHERADVALIGPALTAFEIKTERDSLRRLPRQAAAYGRLFDQCTAVVAPRHVERVAAMVPEWWGIVSVSVNGAVSFAVVRDAEPNEDEIDRETLVRLLWRDEAAAALLRLGCCPAVRSPRSALWEQLVHNVDMDELRAIVRVALLERDRSSARIASRRFTQPAVASGVDR